MKKQLKSPINHMVAGVAHWMAYRDEASVIKPEINIILCSDGTTRKVLI